MGPVAVTAVIDPAIKTGMGKKGQWTMALVRLSNGKETRIFQPIDIGDAVEAYQNGDFTNYRKISGDGGASAPAAVSGKAPQVDNSQLDRIEKQLTLVLEGINQLKGIGGTDEDYEH